ncbi:ABC transporter permease subunit [Sulfuriroseicoccus oceanibius]|uniref:ABC transporter permease subunit n=1 Tax=Sulfuriroseicoccus oceanibius TaxID=2707525 RepID=A0A6B3L516_9BACT|nr:ABC transporter permease subunit [Sulfuriroseicoccus oceanibius]QQL44742.1 ABC transporter permease subunit [Sulfuriroseicoccus oceanibius]
MIRKLAWLLIALSVVAIVAELFALQLPTLRWPFNVSREIPALGWQGEKFIPVFGYLFWLVGILAGAGLLFKFKPGYKLTPITERRLKRFKENRRGYVSFLILIVMMVIAALDHVIVGNEALAVKYNGKWQFPAFVLEQPMGKDFGLEGDAALTKPNYRKLKLAFEDADEGNVVIMPLVPYAPTGDTQSTQTSPLEKREDGKIYLPGKDEVFSGIAIRLYDPRNPDRMHTRMQIRDGLLDKETNGWSATGERVLSVSYSAGEMVEDTLHWTGEGSVDEFLTAGDALPIRQAFANPAPPLPENGHLLGTTSQGYDVLAYLYGGLQVNFKAALVYIPLIYTIGITVGLLMGFFGGTFDLIVQRLIEIFSNIPFLFVIVIVSGSVPDQWKGLAPVLGILVVFGWMGMTYLMRTAALKEKQRDYVAAARVIGCSTPTIIFRHILPNAVAILVTLVPFSISGLIMALTSLDYLGYGLPESYATWGRLLKDGLDNLSASWLATSAFLALVATLILVTFVGEAVRDAFDPKKFTTYR